jgi:hypothetical protein
MRSAARHGVFLLAAGALLCAPGCKAVRKWFSPAEQVELSPGDPFSTVKDATLSDPESRRGLEVRMLVVDDTDYDAPRMLRSMLAQAQGGPVIDQGTRERWSAWGFRMVEIPMSQLDAALGTLTPVRPVSVQWLGEFGAWRPLIRAGASEQTSVRVGESSRTIEPGRPRLIARSWAEPMLTESGAQSVLRLDLGIQIESASRNAFALLPDQRSRTLDDEGQVIDSLLSTITLRGDHAIVIIGEIPEADWEKLPEPTPVVVEADREDDPVGPNEDAQTERPESETERRPFEPGARQPIGPGLPALRSLGELMLVAPGERLTRRGETRNIPRRVLIVLVPSVGGPFEMLSVPGVAGSGGDS